MIIKYQEMAFQALFTGEEVINMLDVEGEDGDLEDFFPGSDEEFGNKIMRKWKCNNNQCNSIAC